MEDQKEQKELFELEKPKKRRFLRLGSIFPKDDFSGGLAVTLTLEKMIFIAIGVIMIVVVVYALGVERGKAISGKKAVVVEPRPNLSAERPPPPRMPAEVRETSKKIEATQIMPKAARLPEAAVKPYTIVAVTFSERVSAEREMTKMRELRFDAFVLESAPYFQVCVGSYADRASAKKDIEKVGKVHRGAYLRNR